MFSDKYISGELVYGDNIYIPEEYMDEKWWYINSCPGYMISDCGRVWSEKSQQFIKPKPMDKHGHLGVCLLINGKRCYKYVHRLIAEAFIPNPNNYPIVRHLNDNPYDNELDNLDWGTQKDNYNDCKRNGHTYIPTDNDREMGFRKIRKPIVAIDIESGKIMKFKGQQEASRILGIQQANIWKVLNGKRSSTCGYRFEYLKEGDENETD